MTTKQRLARVLNAELAARAMPYTVEPEAIHRTNTSGSSRIAGAASWFTQAEPISGGRPST